MDFSHRIARAEVHLRQTIGPMSKNQGQRTHKDLALSDCSLCLVPFSVVPTLPTVHFGHIAPLPSEVISCDCVP